MLSIISQASSFTFDEYSTSRAEGRDILFYMPVVITSRIQDLELEKYQAESGVTPIDRKLGRLDVLKGTRLLSLAGVAFLLNEQV